MSSKASMESKIVEFFQNAPLDKVETVLGIIKPIVKRRKDAPTPESLKASPPAPVKARKKRGLNKSKSSPSSSVPATSFPPPTDAEMGA